MTVTSTHKYSKLTYFLYAFNFFHSRAHSTHRNHRLIPRSRKVATNWNDLFVFVAVVFVVPVRFDDLLQLNYEAITSDSIQWAWKYFAISRNCRCQLFWYVSGKQTNLPCAPGRATPRGETAKEAETEAETEQSRPSWTDIFHIVWSAWRL